MSSKPPEIASNPEPGSSAGHALRAAVARKMEPERLDEFFCSPPPIPDHELLHRIGQGAYGEVWLARNALGTLRAVKILYRSRFEEERPFQREFNGILKYEPVSRTHEGLLAVLHAGRNEEAGCFYYIMELADPLVAAAGAALEGTAAQGLRAYVPRTLRTELQLRKVFPPREAAQLGLRIASALAHLHAHNLVHRDIKPGNVIFVDGKPKLADLGLVTDCGDSRSFVGTEGFIPPEGPGTPQADIYALGKLLYELTTGRDRMDFPQLPPGAADSSEREDLLELNEVFTRACAVRPEERYGSVAELQADLNIFLAGRSLRQVNQAQRNLGWLKRILAAGSICLVLAVSAVWLARNKANQAHQREQVAREQMQTEMLLRQRAEAADRTTQQQLYTALLEQARATVRSGEQGQRIKALEAIRRAASISNTFDLRREALAALALPDVRLERELKHPLSTTISVLDPLFEKVAYSSGKDDVEIRSLSDDRLLVRLPAGSPFPALFAEWSADGHYLALRRYRDDDLHSDLEIWEVQTAKRVLQLQHLEHANWAFHPRVPQLMTGSPEGDTVVWNLESGKPLRRFQLSEVPDLLSIAPDGEHFAASWKDGPRGVAVVYAMADLRPLWTNNWADRVSALEWDPSGKWLGVTDHDSSVELVEALSGQRHLLGNHKFQAVSAAFSADGRYLFTGGWEREVICWDVEQKRKAFVVGLGGFLVQVGRSSGKLALSGAGRVQLLQFEVPEGPRELRDAAGGRIHHAAFNRDGNWLAVTDASSLSLWDLRNNQCALRVPEAAEARVFFSDEDLYASRDDSYFIWHKESSADLRGTVWRQAPASSIRGFKSLCLASNTVVLTADGCSQLQPGAHLAGQNCPWQPTISGVSTASPNGRWLGIFAPYTPTLDIYEMPSLRLVSVLTNRANVRNFAFSQDSKLLAVGLRSGVSIWNTQDWTLASELPEFIDLMFTDDPDQVWLTRDYHTSGLYLKDTLEPLLPLPKGTLPLALSADGQSLATSLDARRLQIWDMTGIRRRLDELGLSWESHSSSPSRQ